MTHRPVVSVIMPYHNNPGMLFQHWAHIASLPDDVRRAIELVICDDASEQPATGPGWDERLSGVPISIFRVPPPHVPWSHRVATNIAAKHARGSFFLVTDMDHIVPLRTWRFLLRVPCEGARPLLHTDRAYQFLRENADGSTYKPHPDSWLFHCSLWEKTKGYDERYRGHYGQNMPFIERVNHYTKIETLPVPLIRYSRDDIPDASERVLTRKTPEAREAIRRLRSKFASEGSFYEDTRGSAAYERVYP